MPIAKNILHKLYVIDKNSMYDISVILHCSINKIVYWLNKYQISRRNKSDANYAKYNPDGDPFLIKDDLTHKELDLYSLAIGLFWGEGNKRCTTAVRLVNSDPQLMQQWCTFLRTICTIRESKIHFHLQTFKDNDVITAKKYWSEQLGISPERIHTSKPIPSQGKGNYKKISTYGVMSTDVYNTHFRSWMMEQLQKLGYNPD